MELLKKIFSPLAKTLNYIQNHFKAMLFLLLLFLLFAPTPKDELNTPNLQEIKLTGAIMDATDLVKQINQVTQDNTIKGVLFSVDSPGGAVAPSVEIAYAIKRLSKIKPVIAYASGTMASGSYYASIWADKIIANPGSMIGSIGVIMQGSDFSGIMQKLGIKTQVVKAGKYKQIGTPDRPWKNYEVKELNKVIQATYDMFSRDVANARKLDYKKRDTFANAHIFTALQAKKVGLIDNLGVKYTAKEILVQLSGVKEARWNQEDTFDKIMKKISASTAIVFQTYFPPLTLR
jgi:protease-4